MMGDMGPFGWGSGFGWLFMSLSAGLPVFENINGSQSEPQWRVIGSIGKSW